MSAMFRGALLPWLLALGCAAPLRAEPYLAVRTGLKCVQCHANPTGGGLRNVFGNAYAQTELAARRIGAAEDAWTGTLGRFIAIGGNVRATASSTHIPDQGDSTTNELEEARVFLDAGLIPNRLSVYVDHRVGAGNAESLEANVRLWVRENVIYVKAGRMYLPFGWRLEDDTSYVRSLSGINMLSPDEAAEIGLEQGPWSAQLAVSNGAGGGTDDDDGKQVTTRIEYVQATWRLGVSGVHNNADSGDRTGGALHAGLRWRSVGLLGEVQYFDDESFRGERNLMASLAEANWMPRKGHNLKLSYEWFEPDREVDEDEQSRTSLLYEWMPVQFMQARFGVRYYHGIPQSDFQNRTLAFAQLHGYF